MKLLRIVNAFYAALFLVMALVSLAFLRASFTDRVGTAENVWVSAGWVVLFLFYAILVFVNMRRAVAEGPKQWLIALNLAAAAPMLAGLVGGEPSGRLLCGVAALPFALTAGMLLFRRRGTPA